MEAKYVQAIKAGIIGSVIIGFCILLILIANVISAAGTTLAMLLGLLGCCILIFIVLLMVGVGALGARMASASIVTLSDALTVSAVTGAVAGLAAGLLYAVAAIVKSLLVHDPSYDIYEAYGLSPSAVQGIFGICCCWPAILVIAVVLAAVGGAIYAVAILKIK